MATKNWDYWHIISTLHDAPVEHELPVRLHWKSIKKWGFVKAQQELMNKAALLFAEKDLWVPVNQSQQHAVNKKIYLFYYMIAFISVRLLYLKTVAYKCKWCLNWSVIFNNSTACCFPLVVQNLQHEHYIAENTAVTAGYFFFLSLWCIFQVRTEILKITCSVCRSLCQLHIKKAVSNSHF